MMEKLFTTIVMLVSAINASSPPCGTVKPFDSEFWKFQNMLRTNPQAFIPYLTDMKRRFAGNNYIDGRNQVHYT